MNCILSRTARKTDFGTLCLLSCSWMTAPMRYSSFSGVATPETALGIAIYLPRGGGALPYLHYVMRSFPLCGVEGSPPRTIIDLSLTCACVVISTTCNIFLCKIHICTW